MSILLLVGVLALAELVLRALFPGKVLIFDSDPATLVQLKPNLRRTSYGAAKVDLKTNAYRFRDSDDFDPRDADILVFGDSNVASFGLDFEDTLGEQLERRLDGRVVAANLSVPGFGPDQSLRRYLHVARDAKARAVVFHVFADNDFGDMIRNNIYSVTPDGLTARRTIVGPDPVLLLHRFLLLRGINKLAFQAIGSISLLDIIGDKDYYPPFHRNIPLPRWSTGVDTIYEWAEVSAREFDEYTKGHWTSWHADHYDYGIAEHPTGVISITARDLLAGILGAAAEHFSGTPECLIVLIQPSENDLLDEGATVGRGQLLRAFPEYFPRALSNIAVKAAKQARVSYINLFDVYEQHPGQYYFSHEEKPGDNHWNAKGIAVAAQLVAAHLQFNHCLNDHGEPTDGLE